MRRTIYHRTVGTTTSNGGREHGCNHIKTTVWLIDHDIRTADQRPDDVEHEVEARCS